MKEQKDRHLEAPGEANRDKRINFLAAENGDVDTASDNQSSDTDEAGSDNGFFTDDDNRLQIKDEYEKDKHNHSGKNEKATPIVESNRKTLDKEPPYEQGEDDQAH